MQASRSTKITVHGDITTTGSSNNINIGLFHGKEEHVTKLKKCRDALFLSDPKIDRARLISEKGKRTDGTFEWIREDKAYKTWHSGDTNLLWINGDPGMGKTILSIFLSQELEGEVDTIFYFCRSNDQERNNAAAVLRGLIWHITEKRAELADVLLEHLSDENRRHVTLNSHETLWSIFVKMLRDPRVGTKYCVLDGLDECDKDSQRWLVAKLVELVSMDRLGSSNIGFKIAIISQPEVSGLKRCTQVRLNPDNNMRVGEDIQKFVSSRVQELASMVSLPRKLLHEVQTTLLGRSGGTFLWVGFAVVELLKKETATDIHRALYSLPKGLPAIYDRMVRKIDEKDRHISLLILRWVTLAFRPLSLGALAAAVGTQPPPHLTLIQAIRDQISMCGPLVKVEGETVRLVHQSARDYLLRDKRDDDDVLEWFRIKPDESHMELAAACVDYLVQTDDQYQKIARRTKGYDRLAKFQEQHPLRRYAVEFWPDHAKASSMVRTILLRNAKFFDEKSRVRERWWQEYSERKWRLPRGFPALHIASYLDIPQWTHDLIKKRKGQLLDFSEIQSYVDERDDSERTPLWWAAEGGHEAVVKLLLDTGKVDVNATDNYGETPLHRATEGGHEVVVQLLLDTGKVKVNATDRDKVTPLYIAARRGQERLVRLLLDNSKVNAADNYGETPLHRATEGGHEAVVQLLLDTGKVDVNAADKEKVTPLYIAARRGQERLVRLLLDNSNIDVNAADEDGVTPLYIAARRGQERLVRLLLDNSKVDVNAADEDGVTPLHLAAEGGHKAVVRLLLANSKVKVNAKDYGKRTPLHLAAKGGHEVVVQLLLANGEIKVDALDDHACTPLWIAVGNRQEAVVQSLLATGKADVEAVGKGDMSPLSLALHVGHKEIRRLLQEHWLRHYDLSSHLDRLSI